MLALMMFPMLAAAKNYFVEGMKWETLLTSMVNPYPTYSLVYDVIDGEETVAGYTAMKLYEYEYDYGEDSHKLKAYLRTEGDKVYFLNPQIDAEKWFLLYDFGLKKGDGCYIYNGGYVSGDSNEPYKSYIECTDIIMNNDYGFSVMCLEEGKSPDVVGTKLATHGVWIKGIGAVTGLLYNNRFETQGGPGTRLVSAKMYNKVVYNSEWTSIDDASMGSIEVKTDGLSIMVENIEIPTILALYSSDGFCLCRKSVQSGNTEFVVPTDGLYLLKIGNVTKKIFVAG